MTSKNPITGDLIQSKMNSAEFEKNFDRIFRRKETFETLAQSVKENEVIVIFEHDAIVTGEVPVNENFDGCMTFSKPSYGRFNTPIKLGVDGLVQKKYFGGAHGYMVNPEGAKKIISKAKTCGAPTDVFLNVDNFSFLQEYYPWVCMAADSFTTIQKEAGVQAKHNYGETYRIIDA